jgi:hypothetical protein
MRRARNAALLLALAATASGLAACSGGEEVEAQLPAALPVAAVDVPAAVTPVAVGDEVTPGDRTPASVKRALKSRSVVVVAFLLPGAADDRQVAAALRTVQAESVSPAVRFFVYEVGRTRSFGDVADLLGVDGTPTVAVIGRDARLLKVFPGLTDASILRQAIRSARERDPVADAGADPAPDAGVTPLRRGPRGSPRGIALARKVNASYAKVPGVSATASGRMNVVGPVDVTIFGAFEKGKATGTSVEYASGRFSLHLTTEGEKVFMRVDEGCWAAPPGDDFESGLGVGEPMLPLAGTSFGVPHPRGANVVFPVRERGEPKARRYTVVRATSLVVSATDAELGTVRFSSLPATPEIPVAQPRCSSPSELAADLREAVSRG